LEHLRKDEPPAELVQAFDQAASGPEGMAAVRMATVSKTAWPFRLLISHLLKAQTKTTKKAIAPYSVHFGELSSPHLPKATQACAIENRNMVKFS
jgi:hypothetical protein